MSLDWANERYVRVYTRDTTTWKLCDWRARTVLLHLFRKVDRSGVLDVGDDGVAGLAAVLELPLEEIVEPGIAQLVKRGTVEMTSDAYIIPNFLEAQETPASDAQRQRAAREKRRASKRNRDEAVTNRDASVTHGHDTSRGVTPSLPVPDRSDPDSLSVAPAGARDPGIHQVVPAPTPAPLGPLVEHAVTRLDAARSAMDPKAQRIGTAIHLPSEQRDQLLGKLRRVDERERRQTLDHCLDVLIAAARAANDVGMLRVGMLAGEASWDQWRLATVESVSRPRAPPGRGRAPNPRVGFARADDSAHHDGTGITRVERDF